MGTQVFPNGKTPLSIKIEPENKPNLQIKQKWQKCSRIAGICYNNAANFQRFKKSKRRTKTLPLCAIKQVGAIRKLDSYTTKGEQSA